MEQVYTASTSIGPKRTELKALAIELLGKVSVLKLTHKPFLIDQARGFESAPLGTIEVEAVYSGSDSIV